jgi:2-methylcitrate dehydratase
MVRYLDFNDLYVVPAGDWYIGVHPSDAIPGILALAEYTDANGKDLIEAIALSYELSARFCHAATNPPLSKLGWNPDTRGVYVTPLVAGKLLKLTNEQLENAFGISGCHGMLLGILDAAEEEYTMTKNIRYSFTVQGGILASLLAKRGFTGPKTVIEGSDGFNKTIMKGSLDLDKLTTPETSFHIMDTGFKPICAVGAVQGHLNATLELVNTHNIKPEEIEQIKITAGTRTIKHTGDPAKKYPTNKETADHSSYYLTAIAIIDRAITPEQYQDWKYRDPEVLKLIEKISLDIDPEMNKHPRSGRSMIAMKDGKIYDLTIDLPKGDPQNSMSDEELEKKFKSLAVKWMNDNQMQMIIETIGHLDKLDDVKNLTRQLVFEKRNA